VRVPVILVREGLVDTVIEVLVVREDNVAADVVELEVPLASVGGGQTIEAGTTDKSLWSDVGRGQTTRRLIRVHDQP
jgi:hypothetical protein